MRTRWIKRSEAAQILGVSAQSISNYAERGVLHMQVRNRICYFPESEVLALADCPEIHEAEAVKERMGQLLKEEEDLYGKLETGFREKRTLFFSYFHDGNCWRRYKEVADTAIGVICSDELNTRERQILDCVLQPMPLDQIANKFGITIARVQQIFQKALRKIKTFTETNEKRIESLQQAVKERDDLIESLKAQIGEQNYQIAKHENPDIRFRKEYPFTVKMRDWGLSVRAYNICKVLDIETVGDLVGTRKLSIIRCRNCGRKTMQELNNVIDNLSLSWEMWDRTKGLS